jgi:hypothetical protein
MHSVVWRCRSKSARLAVARDHDRDRRVPHELLADGPQHESAEGIVGLPANDDRRRVVRDCDPHELGRGSPEATSNDQSMSVSARCLDTSALIVSVCCSSAAAIAPRAMPMVSGKAAKRTCST